MIEKNSSEVVLIYLIIYDSIIKEKVVARAGYERFDRKTNKKLFERNKFRKMNVSKKLNSVYLKFSTTYCIQSSFILLAQHTHSRLNFIDIKIKLLR